MKETKMQLYTKTYYKRVEEKNWTSARAIVPWILDWVKPTRVVDVGCGVGIWLAVFKEYGVKEILGIDGNYVDRKMLHIPEDCFLSFDLRKPLEINKRFDLVVSLEVAEHLPPECAETYVDSLVGLGPLVLFSAAIPFQDGEEHLNEQWPVYWQRLFEKKGYVAIDCIRRRIWNEENVYYWYAQNMFLYVKKDQLDAYPQLKQEYESVSSHLFSLVHPTKYLEAVYLADLRNRPIRELLSTLPILIKNSIKRKIEKFVEKEKTGNP